MLKNYFDMNRLVLLCFLLILFNLFNHSHDLGVNGDAPVTPYTEAIQIPKLFKLGILVYAGYCGKKF